MPLSELATAISILGGLGGLAGLVGAFVIIPYRVAALEARVKQAEDIRQADHDLLTRIEERVVAIQEKLNA